MDMLIELWLPIGLSAAAVWIASALAWMVMPHHKGEFRGLPNENAVLDVLRAQNLKPGVYGFPDIADHSKMKDPAFVAKLNQGPVGMVHVWPPGAFTKMGGKMFATFMFYVVVSGFVAYLAGVALNPKLVADPGFWRVFRITGTAAIMAYCFAGIPNSIWFNTPARSVGANLLDGVVYGLITAAIFGWLWPYPH